MSLETNKSEQEKKTTQPRLYKRGNDDIDLNEYIRNAESEFGFWLANSRLKNKEKLQVREAYSKMLLGINDGTFTYKIGGGYNNSIGMINIVDDLDAPGLAAGFLGSILRKQSVYTIPDEKPAIELPVDTLSNPDETLTVTPVQPTTSYINEDEWRTAVHPKSTVTDFNSRVLTTNAVYKREGRIKLNLILMNMPKENLLELIRLGFRFKPTGQELNKGRSILKGFGQLTSFENNFILRLALEAGRRRNLFHQFPNDKNSYYIPFVSNTLDARRTGIVYHISLDGNHVLKEIDRWDIPFYIIQWHNDFMKLIPVHKLGGMIRKFASGGADDWKTLKGLYIYEGAAGKNMYFNNTNNTWNARVDPAKSNDLKRSTYNIAYNATDLENRDEYTAWLEDLKLDEKLAESWATEYLTWLPKDPNASDNTTTKAYQYWKNLWYVNDKFDHKKFLDSVTVDNKKLWLDLKGGPGHDIRFRGIYLDESDGKWHEAVPDDYEVVGDWDFHPDKLRWVRKIKSNKDINKDEDGDKGYDVEEEHIPPIKENLETSKWKEAVPYVLRFGKLYDSLHTNRKVYDTVRPSLKPILKNTYERFSPVTGAFSLMQLKNRLGADANYQSHLALTSDARLEASRKYEALKYANLLLAEGFLADDQEIRRTKAEALARQEDNMSRRSEVANFNRSSINQTNRELALLKASYLKMNNLSRQNFYDETIKDITNKLNENQTLSNALRERISMDSANRWYNSVMESANNAKDEWIKLNTINGVTPDITKWSLFTKYNNHRKLAEDMKEAMLKRDLSKMYDMNYTSPYADEAYDEFYKKPWK